jgi:hypothetical protein
MERDLINYTCGEQKFLEEGGKLFCAYRSRDNRWDLFSICKDGKVTYRIRPASRHRAQEWIYAFALVSSYKDKVSVHHEIARRNEGEAVEFPIL